MILLLDQKLFAEKLLGVLAWPMTGSMQFWLFFQLGPDFQKKRYVAAVRSLETIFGSRILDYIIVVFTGGDDFEDDNGTFEDYLGSGCPPEPLKVTPKAANNFASLLLALENRFLCSNTAYISLAEHVGILISSALPFTTGNKKACIYIYVDLLIIFKNNIVGNPRLV